MMSGESVTSKKIVINNTILNMEKPFKISQLFLVLEEKGIEDKDLILEVLNQLYEKGMVDSSEVENDIYISNFK